MKIKTNISQIRFKYKKESFDISNANSDPFKQFIKWFNEALKFKVFEPTAMTLSTCKKTKVSSRIVLLKGIEKKSFVFYTNLNSRKSSDIKNNSNVAAVFWWPQIGKQVRIEGNVKKVNKKDADIYFSTRSRKSQIGSWASDQSNILKNRKTLLSKFAIIEKRFENKEIKRPNYWS